jgi:hypothetical protein
VFIIFGTRPYGRVDAVEGEYAQTSFFHIYYMPLIPVKSAWVTQKVAFGEAYGLPTNLNWKSIAATYLRTWIVVAAIITWSIAPGIGTGVAALSLLAASAASYRWRSLRGERAKRRSDFNLLAFGTRCDPSLMTDDIRANMRAALETQNRAGRPPDDVARFGPTSLGEAAIAYGLLRLAACERRGGNERALAEQLIDGARDKMPEGDGPYRAVDAGVVAPQPAALDDAQVAEAVKATRAARAGGVEVAKKPWWQFKGNKAAAVGLLGLIAMGGILNTYAVWFGHKDIQAADVSRADEGRYVRVRCDSISDEGVIENLRHKVTDRVFVCETAHARNLIVLADPDTLTLDNVVDGKLRRLTEAGIEWPRDMTSAAYPQFLDTRGYDSELAESFIALGLALAAIGLAIFWWRRSKRSVQPSG